MEIVILIISMIVCLIGGVLKKYYTICFSENTSSRQIYNMVTCLVAMLVLFFWGGVGSSLSWFTVILGIGFGVLTGFQQISNLKAIECGPWSYTSVITTLSTLIPALSGGVIWHESLHWAQIIGMVLMVVCFLFSIETQGEQKQTSIKWLIWCGIAFICTGFIGVMQKWHQSSDYKTELNTFLVIAFAISAVYSIIALFIAKAQQTTKIKILDNTETKDVKEEKGRWLYIIPFVLMIVAGICGAVNNKLNLYLSGVMDSAVFFPIVNGGGLILTTITAVVLFKEKLSKKQWLGLIIGIISVIFLANPFGE